MDIIILSEFCDDFSLTDNDRFLYLAKKLCHDNEVEIVTSSFIHTKKTQREHKEPGWPFKVTFIREPGYPRNICLKRFQSHKEWGKNVLEYIQGRKKPDVIYCAVPSLTGPHLIAKYCERNHIRFIVDVQDLWPEAFQLIVNFPAAFKPLTMLADGIYKRADAICGVSDTYCRRAASVNRKAGKPVTVFLGTDLAVFDRFAAERPILTKNKEEVWLAYCGTLGSSYDLTCVIDALTRITDLPVRFIVMGDGPRFDEFKRYAEEKEVPAVFTGRIPYNEMCCLLSECDITVNPISYRAAQSIINKHADYAASGKPVISTQENREYRDLVDEFQMGYNCRNNDSEDLADKIRKLVGDPELRLQMGRNARRCAEEKFDRAKTYQKLVQIIENGCETDGII